LEIARARLAEFGDKVTLVHANFSQIGRFSRAKAPPADGVLAIWAYRACNWTWASAVFLSRAAARYAAWIANTEERQTHCDTAEEKALANLLYELAEERDSRRIARTIVRRVPYGTRTSGTVVAGVRKVRGRQKLASRDKNVSGAADCGESRDGELGSFF